MIYEEWFNGIVVSLKSSQYLAYNPDRMDWSICRTIPVNVFRSCKQISREAREVFYEQAQFKLQVLAWWHAWMDASRPELKPEFCFKYFHQGQQQFVQNIRHLDLTICTSSMHDEPLQMWLNRRMTYRKNCLFFDQLLALKSITVTLGDSGRPPRSVIEPTRSILSDVTFWMIQAIPTEVKLLWNTTEAFQKRFDLSSETLTELEEQHQACRATAPSVNKQKRKKRLSEPDPDFMVAWSKRAKQGREALKPSKDTQAS